MQWLPLVFCLISMVDPWGENIELLPVPDFAGDESVPGPGAAGPNVMSEPPSRDPNAESEPALDSILPVTV